jgi:DnaK suppressor protein
VIKPPAKKVVVGKAKAKAMPSLPPVKAAKAPKNTPAAPEKRVVKAKVQTNVSARAVPAASPKKPAKPTVAAKKAVATPAPTSSKPSSSPAKVLKTVPPKTNVKVAPKAQEAQAALEAKKTARPAQPKASAAPSAPAAAAKKSPPPAAKQSSKQSAKPLAVPAPLKVVTKPMPTSTLKAEVTAEVKPAVKAATKPATRVSSASQSPTKNAAAKAANTAPVMTMPSALAPGNSGNRFTDRFAPAARAAPKAFPEYVEPPKPAKVDPKVANAWKTKAGRDLSEAELLAMPEAEYMNDKQIDFFRVKLLQQRDDLLSNAGETTEHLREDTTIVPDPVDRATIEEENALELRTRDRERKLLKKVAQAIALLDTGEYGYCDETGEPIGLARLLARPTATLSLEAQQRREIKQKMFGS